MGRIETDPDIMGGKPVIRGTRIPVDTIAEMLVQGLSCEAILREYPTLTTEDVAAVVSRSLDRLRWLEIAADGSELRVNGEPWRMAYKPSREF